MRRMNAFVVNRRVQLFFGSVGEKGAGPRAEHAEQCSRSDTNARPDSGPGRLRRGRMAGSRS
jgi:hypothetical protein